MNLKDLIPSRLLSTIGAQPEKTTFAYLILGTPLSFGANTLLPGSKIMITSAQRTLRHGLSTVWYTCFLGSKYPQIEVGWNSKHRIVEEKTEKPDIELRLAR